jgi:WD40 repeat protein
MVWSLAYAATGSLLASGGFDQTTRLWNPQNGKRLAVLRGPKTPICGLAFSPDGETLYVASQERNVYRYRAHPVELPASAAGTAETEAKQ